MIGTHEGDIKEHLKREEEGGRKSECIMITSEWSLAK